MMINFIRRELYGIFDDCARILDITLMLMPDEWRFTENTLATIMEKCDEIKDRVGPHA